VVPGVPAASSWDGQAGSELRGPDNALLSPRAVSSLALVYCVCKDTRMSPAASRAGQAGSELRGPDTALLLPRAVSNVQLA
jgi:hypothetical protein